LKFSIEYREGLRSILLLLITFQPRSRETPSKQTSCRITDQKSITNSIKKKYLLIFLKRLPDYILEGILVARENDLAFSSEGNIHYTMLMHVLVVFKVQTLRTRQQNVDIEVSLMVPFPNFPWSHGKEIQKKCMATEVCLPSIGSFSRGAYNSKTVLT